MPLSNNAFYLLLLETIDEIDEIEQTQPLKPKRANALEPLFDEDDTKWGSRAFADTPPPSPTLQ